MRILIIGDSQAGAPGAALEALLNGLGASVKRIFREGQGPADWSRSHWSIYASALDSFRPTDVILIFGSNDPPNEALQLAMERFWQSHARVWYAGPPRYQDEALQRRGAAVRTMARRVFGARYLDAWPFTGPAVPRAPDGVHFGRAGAQAWARGMFSEWTDAGAKSATIMLLVGISVAAAWWWFRGR
jgi:hypothetical protein